MSSSRSRSTNNSISSGGSSRSQPLSAERSTQRRSLRSPRISPPSTNRANDLLEITVKSVMEGVQTAKVLVPPMSSVSELKTIVSDATDVSPEKQLLLYKNKELKNDNDSIRNYGITSDCTIMMNVKMNTGSKLTRSHNNVNMLFLPLVMQQGSISNLRSTIKSMTSVSGSPVESSSSTSIPKRKSANIEDKSLTEKQLKVFFDPPESVEEMMITRSIMVMPPANMDELMKMKAKRKESEKKICKFCYRKLPLTEQHIQCLCKQNFCKKHRQPSAHYCSVDYKQKGRCKISRENPKISEGGYHKAKQN